jgi:hypothetical protein
MKRILCLYTLLIMAFVSCKKDGKLIDDVILLPTDLLFEDFKIGRFTHKIPAESFTSAIATFNVKHENNDWSGFAISNRNYKNFVTAANLADSTRFSVYTLTPHAGGNFLVVRPKGDDAFVQLSRPIQIDKVLVGNTVQVYQTIMYGPGNSTVGNTFAPGTTIMSVVRKDNLKITIKGFLNNVETGTVDFLLADRSSDALKRSFTVTDWMPISLLSLGKVNKIVFYLESTDKTAGVMNTPNYFCLDGIRFTENIN